MNHSRLGEVCEAGSAILQKVLQPVCTYLSYVSSALTLVMAFLVVVDLSSRFLMNMPIASMLELETFLLIVMGFFGIGFTTMKDGHVRVELIVSKLGPKVRTFLTSLFSSLGCLLFSIFAWQNSVRAVAAYHRSEIAEIAGIPNYPFYLIASLGCFLGAAALLRDLLGSLAQMAKEEDRRLVRLLLLLGIFLGIAGSPIWLKSIAPDLNAVTFGTMGILFMLALMFLGFPVAFSMGFIGFLGTCYIAGTETALGVLRMGAYDAVAHYFLCVVPFFILMGLICLHAGISKALFDASRKWFGGMPGGLAITSIFGCTGFASICGDSMATAATMGSIALPEMKKHGYDDALATGVIAAGGTLGILIPPSLGFVVYAIVTEESIGKLFIAGFLPGIMLAILFSLVVYVRCKITPSLGPGGPRTSFFVKAAALIQLWKVVLLFLLVIGGIYSGYVTPTEAAGIGVVGALLLAVISREFTWEKLFEALQTTTQITAMVFTILIGVAILGYFVTLTDIPMKFAQFIASLPVSRYTIFVLVLLLYVFLGMVMNIIPMVLLTLPIIFPTIKALGFDPIWFGVIMVIMMEMGQITPPVGMNVFTIHGVTKNVPMSVIFRGVMPFVAVQVLAILILTIFPGIALVLPNLMDVLPELK